MAFDFKKEYREFYMPKNKPQKSATGEMENSYTSSDKKEMNN